jgi:hypothetical protein
MLLQDYFQMNILHVSLFFMVLCSNVTKTFCEHTHAHRENIWEMASNQFLTEADSSLESGLVSVEAFLFWLLCVPGEERSGAFGFQHASPR